MQQDPTTEESIELKGKLSEENHPNNQKKKINKNKKVNNDVKVIDFSIFKHHFSSIFSQNELKEEDSMFIRQNIVPLNNKHVPNFVIFLRKQFQIFHINPNIITFQHALLLYSKINRIYRQNGVNSPILIATYHQFQSLWKQLLKFLPLEQVNSKLISLWRQTPYQILHIFLNTFSLYERFYRIDCNQLITMLGNDLFQCKIQQTVQYYILYTTNHIFNQKQKQIIDTFQNEQLIPRLTKKDQLFTSYVLNLLRKNTQISHKIYKIIDIQQQQKLMNLIQDNPSNHKRVIERASKRHYHDIINKNKQWYIIQDKLSYSSTFLTWYAQDILKDNEENQQNQTQNLYLHLQFHNKQEAMNISKSIMARVMNNPSKEFIKNPLYKYDSFIPAQLLMQEHKLTKTTYQKQNFIYLQQTSVIFIDSINKDFTYAEEDLLNSKIIGFDSQFMPTQSKFQQGGVSIIQLASLTKCYIFDYHILRNTPLFIDFFISLMQNPQILKIGHTFSSDLKYLSKNFPKELHPQSLIDISKLFKQQYPHEIYTSLGYLCNKFLGKQMCKYQQRSNWARRPLKKTQLYYAALDADVCLRIYKELAQDKGFQLVQCLGKEIKSGNLEEKGSLEFNFVKFKEYTKNPIFLVDNMLKKLCSTMRNCGIDTEYISIRDHQLAQSQCLKQKRILLTRDTKLHQRKSLKTPIYLIKQKSDTQIMFQEIISTFSIDLSNYSSLSRCVKCNGSDILIISSEEAMKEVKFIYETKITTFWRCAKCRQIYWEGGQFTKAKTKFDALRKNQS